MGALNCAPIMPRDASLPGKQCELLQSGSSYTNRRAACREGSGSRHHVGTIKEPPETPYISQQYGTEELRGALNFLTIGEETDRYMTASLIFDHQNSILTWGGGWGLIEAFRGRDVLYSCIGYILQLYVTHIYYI